MEQQPEQKPKSNNIIKSISQVLAAISAATLSVMMFLTVADVCTTNLFFRPIEGTAELVGLLLVVTAALGLGWCQLVKGNVRITIAWERFSLRGRSIIDICNYVICIAATSIIAWQGALMVHEYMSKQLGSKSTIMGVLLWPFIIVMVIGFTWATVIFLIDLYKSFVEVFKR